MSHDNQEKLYNSIEKLREEYGVPEPSGRKDPVVSLIKTILSQNTNDKNRDMAAERLFERIGSPSEILEADLGDIEDAVRPAGLGNTKAKRIKEFLKKLKREEGEITLEHVEEMDVDEAKKYLKSFKGIGPKTAAVTLLFVFGKPLMPVDTHVHRVSKRLGLIDENCSRDRAHDILEEKVPKKRMYEFHINLIKHGRSICSARDPKCEKCSLKQICMYYQNR